MARIAILRGLACAIRRVREERMHREGQREEEENITQHNTKNNIVHPGYIISWNLSWKFFFRCFFSLFLFLFGLFSIFLSLFAKKMDSELLALEMEDKKEKEEVKDNRVSVNVVDEVSVGDGGECVVKMDELGPIIVNYDGSLQRIVNWNEMTEAEQKNTIRLITQRNRKRMGNLRT